MSTELRARRPLSLGIEKSTSSWLAKFALILKYRPSSANPALQPTPGDRRGPIEARGRARLSLAVRQTKSGDLATSLLRVREAATMMTSERKRPVRPSVFIGSSAEGLRIAKFIQVELDHACEVTIWSQGVFGLGDGTLEALVRAVGEFDFAILVLTPDDLVESRGAEKQAPRDNVLLELGLFLGALGRQRTFEVHDRTANLKLPSDLAGVTPATYEPHASGNLRAALGAPCTLIEDVIRRLGRRPERELAKDATTISYSPMHNKNRDEVERDRLVHEDFPPQFDTDLATSTEIWLLGVHQSDIMIRYHALLERKIRDGVRLRVLLVDPRGNAAAMAVLRFPGNVRADQERVRIRSSLRTLVDLKKINPSGVEIRVIDFLLPYGGFLLNPESELAVAYLQRYTFRILGGSRKPKLVYRRQEGRWYDLIHAEYCAFWDSATPWNESTTNRAQKRGSQPIE
jgi:predicted nucleotide-binding protein